MPFGWLPSAFRLCILVFFNRNKLEEMEDAPIYMCEYTKLAGWSWCDKTQNRKNDYTAIWATVLLLVVNFLLCFRLATLN